MHFGRGRACRIRVPSLDRRILYRKRHEPHTSDGLDRHWAILAPRRSITSACAYAEEAALPNTATPHALRHAIVFHLMNAVCVPPTSRPVSATGASPRTWSTPPSRTSADAGRCVGRFNTSISPKSRSEVVRVSPPNRRHREKRFRLSLSFFSAYGVLPIRHNSIRWFDGSDDHEKLAARCGFHVRDVGVCSIQFAHGVPQDVVLHETSPQQVVNLRAVAAPASTPAAGR